jgi:hypothetical protein
VAGAAMTRLSSARRSTYRALRPVRIDASQRRDDRLTQYGPRVPAQDIEKLARRGALIRHPATLSTMDIVFYSREMTTVIVSE